MMPDFTNEREKLSPKNAESYNLIKEEAKKMKVDYRG